MANFKIVHNIPYFYEGEFRIDSYADVTDGPLILVRAEFKTQPTEAEVAATRAAQVQELHAKVPGYLASAGK